MHSAAVSGESYSSRKIPAAIVPKGSNIQSYHQQDETPNNTGGGNI